MDTSIRNLLVAAQKHAGTEKSPSLLQAYGLLRNVAETRPAVDAPEPFNSDLYVLCAEIAFQNGSPDMARECLKMFFMKPPPANQFLCRAYLCQAQLLAPQDANTPEKLEKAVVYLLKAISFAKKNQRYHFLVYNASVLYWQFCRPFLKPNFRQYLARSLHQVVKALDDIDDKDYEWRAQLMIALIECHLDAGRRSDASHIAAAAVTFIKQNVPSLHKQVFGLMVRHQLVESAKFHKDLKSSPELSIYYKICKIKVSLEQGDQKEYYSEIQSIMNQMGVPHMPTGRVARYDTKGSMSNRPRSPSISPTGKEEDVPRDRKSPGKGGRRTPTPTTSKKIPVDSADKPYLLLELGRLCLELDFADLADSCVEHTKTCIVKDQGFYLELEFLQCELMVKSLAEKQESYHKSAIDVRQHAIKRCEEAIMNAIRQGDPNVLQAGCVTQWNLCLPLLQPNLRQTVRKPLTLVAEALEDVHSLLIQLRCQVHTELAKCEEDREQIQVAMEHLRKALSLDDGGVYRERLEVSLHRLELRSELYKSPERPEDQAAMIIEQARTADSGTIRMKRSLLVKAGEALAPDAFLLVLDSESDTKDMTGGKGPLTVIRQLAGKARQFTKCVKKAEGHLKRLGNENERERARLWADLAKTARKQEVWDVCRVASRFCLLYDDGRWTNSPPVKTESPKLERSRTAERESREDVPVIEKSSSRIGSRPVTPVKVALYDKDLIRILAEINFIQGEALIHLLRGENIQLNDQPIPPEDKSKHPKGYVPKKPEEDPEWIEYCDWINSLSESATNSFLRGLALGVELTEAWLVCSAAAYVWNYNNHVFTQDRHREVITTLSTVLDGLKAVGHAGETNMLVNICNALATGLMKPWMPEPPPRDSLEASPSPIPGDKSPSKSKGKSAAASNKSKTPYTVTISPDAQPDLKKAIEVCEYVMQVTNGDNPQDVVPISVRLQLLQTWVFAKQMAQAQINKNLGTDDDHNTEGQRPMTRAIVATEMMCLAKNGIMEFKETPYIGDIVQMVEDCTWSDKFVELQIWSRLTYQAFLAKLHALVMRCSKQALKFSAVGTTAKGKKLDAHRYMVEQEMLSYSSGLQGQSLIENMGGKNALRREAMEAFLNSARFARNANNYELVMSAARHYWNACLPLVGQPIERELLKEPLRVILQCISATAEKTPKKEDSGHEKEDSSDQKAPEVKGDEVKDTADVKDKKSGMIGNPEEDLTLRAALYGVLFQSYADKGEWEQALQSMDQAVNDMPRTKHRLLIFKHRVMVKAKLGRAVHVDIQKFKDESEDYVAHMWRRVALSSKETLEQMSSYQYAIEALNSPSNEWQKVDYLLEFGQWLYVNDFPLPDAIDQIEWAIDILLNMKDGGAAGDAQRTHDKGAGHKGDSKKGQMKAKREKKKASKSSARPRGGSTGRKSPEGGKKTPDNMSKASDVRSDVSDSESEINPADYIPVIKQAEIGVLPANPALAVSDLTDITQLDALIRAHIILAELHGRNSQAYTDICLMAHGYLMQLWKVCMSAAGPVMKELAKTASDTNVAGKKSASSKKDKKEKEVPKEKPKRKGPLDALPSTTEEWAVYDAPDEALEAFKQETITKNGINSDTLKKPMLTLYYLDSLITILRDVGYTHLTLPVLAFQDMMSRGLLLNNALHAFVHIRTMEVCQELDLKTGASFHEKMISPIVISEEDQAKSREEIAIMKEKQTQVAREEMRVKATLAQLAEEAHAQKRGPTPYTPGFHSVKPEEVTETESHLGKVLGAVTFREIWADTAEVLIRQGLYSRAREFLNEAITAAKEFKDKPLEARILYLLGKLSFEEAQFGQAVNLCKMAQDLHSGDEVFWYDTTVLMVDATLNDYDNRRAKRTARKILIQSMNEFTRIYEERPNRMGVTGFILANLEGRLASVQADILLTEHKNVNNPQIMKGVLSACEKFENATENLIKLYYRREALPLMKKHASVLRHLAREAIEKDIAHMYYLQSVLVLKEAACLAEEIYQDSVTLHGLQETRNLSLPVQREFVDLQIEVGDVLTEILHVHAKEARIKQLDDQRKGSVVKMVEDLIRQTPVYTHMEKEWEESKQNCAEEAMSCLLSAHSLCGNISRLRARSLCILGKCLSILSQHSGPDQPPHWLVQEMELLKLHTEGCGEEGGEGEEKEANMEEPEDRQHHKYAKQIKQMKRQHTTSKYYLSQATECLTQCLNLSLTKKYTDLAGIASIELVDCFGQFDPGAASNFLSLHQSCAASQAMKKVLCRSQLDPVTSRLAALLNQRENLLANDIQTNVTSSPLMASVETTLEQDWQAWKKIEILPNYLEFLREFPPNFNFVVLQHHPDKNFLYGALLDKLGKPLAGGGKPNPKQMAGPSKARVFGMETSPCQLEELICKFRHHKQSVQQMLLKQEYQRTQAALRTRMLENLDDSMKGLESRPQTEGEAANEVERLQEEFRSLVAAMDDYLKPIMTSIETAFRSAHSPLSSVNVGKDPKVEPTPSQECVIILADLDLLEMPLEAMECLKADNIFSLSRDFSLQAFYHRFHQEQPVVEESAGDKKKKKADTSQVVSRIPGAREAKQKQAKIIPLDRKPEPWQLAVDTMNFRYIVDPQNDCPETEEHKPLEQLNKVIEEYEQQFTPRWLGLAGEEHTPSVGEWEIYITESSSFIFYGMERLLSYLPPSKISALNIPDCLLVYALDMAQTSRSFLRQSKVDVLKSHNTLALEKPVEAAMLVSMSGVKCLMANQWHCTLAENSDRLQLTMKDMLEKGKTTGEAVRLLFSPKKRRQEEEKAAADQDGGTESVAAESHKGDQKGGDTNRSKDTDSLKGGKKMSVGAESQPESKEESKEGEDDPDKDKEEPKELEETALARDWFNMVCYGLPNLIITQV